MHRVPDRCDRSDTQSDFGALARLRFELGRATWAQIPLAPVAFEHYFVRHATGADVPKEAFASDMYLACACAESITPALASIERTMLADVARAVASIDPSAAFVEETLQAMREKLFVRKADKPGRIIDYGGRGSLRGWLCAVAVRSAIARRRRKAEQRHQPLASRDDRRLACGGPEFELLRARYKVAFEHAVRDAIDHLPAKERMLLRLNLVEGMSIDKLGTLYGVGRSTAARWLASARATLFEQARRELRARVTLTSTELDDVATDLRSLLDVSVLRLLAE
jgi:RNA polymerase sigma-70 factor (ECF subfamily)